MKPSLLLLLLPLLLNGLIGCHKQDAPARPTLMSAQVNGESWHTVAAVRPPYAQVGEFYFNGALHRHDVFIEGGSATDLGKLGIRNFSLRLSATYMPKIGRHYFNNSYGGPFGPPNAATKYLSASIQYDTFTGDTYRAGAVDGFLDIAEVKDKHVAGTFEFTAPTVNAPATSGTPAVLKVEKGAFYAEILGFQGVAWDEVQ
jgi:hypothetical protein